MAKQLLSFSLRLDVDPISGSKRVVYVSGSANDTVLTNYTAGVSCSGMPRALTSGELTGSLASFLTACQADLTGIM